MKKKLFFCFFPVLLCLLAGCQCKHQWTEADCMQPQTCSLCGVTEGEALGHSFRDATCLEPETCSLCGMTRAAALSHSFQEATCSQPETCSLCGATQGETLPHEYSQWTLAEPDMVRSCSLCAAEEAVPIDRESYLKQQLTRFWSVASIQMGGGWINVTSQMPATYYGYLSVSADASTEFCSSSVADFMDAIGPVRGSWTFGSYKKLEEPQKISSGNEFLDIYTFTITNENNTVYTGKYMDGMGRCPDWVEIDCKNGYKFRFTQMPLTDSAVMGYWTTIEGGELCYLHLKEDHTLSGYIGYKDGDVSGNWYAWPAVKKANGDYIQVFQLRIESGKSEYIKPVSFTISAEDYPELSPLVPITAKRNFYFRDLVWETLSQEHWCLYDGLTPEEFEQMRQYMAEAENLLCQNWTSIQINKEKFNPGVAFNYRHYVHTRDYGFTFSPDRTFSCLLDQEYTGTWSWKYFRYQELKEAQELGQDFKYPFNFQLDLEEPPSKLGMQGNLCNGNLTFIIILKSDYTYINLVPDENMDQWDAFLQDFASQIVGTYPISEIQQWDTTDNIETKEDLSGYSMEFREDGTFLLKLEKEYTGTWEFGCENINREYPIFNSHTVWLNMDELPHTRSAYFSQQDVMVSFHDISFVCYLPANQWFTSLPTGSGLYVYSG